MENLISQNDDSVTSLEDGLEILHSIPVADLRDDVDHFSFLAKGSANIKNVFASLYTGDDDVIKAVLNRDFLNIVIVLSS